MKLRPLVIDESARAEIARVRAHAEANHYHRRGPPPGDDPRFVAQLGTYRAVFTITSIGEGRIARHLSVSVPGTKYANPVAVFMIAEEFGFTGWGGTGDPARDRAFGPHNWERCVIVAQEIANQ